MEPVVICNDSSTYGTFVNDGINSKTKLARNTSATLKSDEKVRFGLQWNTFKSVLFRNKSKKIALF